MKTIPVILVDDDFLVLQDLQTLVEWEANGFTVVGTAGNGKQALSLFHKLKPQIVITDIKMPIMDGLELARSISELSPTTRIIILTSFDEFEYAKQAIGYGAVEYLLKNEINANSFLQLLLKTKSSIITGKRAEKNLVRLDLENYFKLPQAEYSPVADSISLIMKHKYYFFMIVKRLSLNELFFSKKFQTTIEDLSIIEKTVIHSKLCTYDESILIQVTNNITVLGFQLPDIPKDIRAEYLRTKASEFAKYFCAEAGDSFLLYTQQKLSLSVYKSAYLKVQPYIEYAAYFYRLGSRPMHQLMEYLKKNTLTGFDFKELPMNVNSKPDFMDKVKPYTDMLEDSFNYSAAYLFFNGLLSYFNHLSHYDVAPELPDNFSDKKQIVQWISETYDHCTQAVESQTGTQYSNIVNRAIDYIKINYKLCDLSAEQITSHVALSTSRLGYLFRQETGKTINEYLTDTRINAAMNLLKNSNYKIYEIAEMVGYGSSQYFSKLFFKKINKRPIDFR